MADALKHEWEENGDQFVVTDEHGAEVLTADDFEATFKGGDMEWSFVVEGGREEAQWIAEMAEVALDQLYSQIAAERTRRRRTKGGSSNG